MWHIIHRLGAVFAVVLIGLVVLGHSPTLQVALGEELQMKPPSKIAHIVEQVVSKCYEARSSQDLSALSNAVLHVTPSGKIELLLHAAKATGPSEEADLENLGATIVSRLQRPPDSNLPPAGMIQAWVPYDKVAAAAALPWVVAVTSPSYGDVDPHPLNLINSEGVALHRADLVQDLGITGAGVTVGVISDGVTNLAASQALNELSMVTVLAVGTGDEGTAMLEIVHDMAPGATLLFHATGSGVVGHVNALNTLVANGVNVIAEDIAFDAQPAFQQGIAAATAEAIAAAGVSVHSSAGNLGLQHAARVLAVGTGGGPDGVPGPFVGCPRFSAPNVVAIAPGGDTTFDIVLGDQTSITLQWSEPRAIFPTAGQGGFTDLDLFVMDAGLTRCLAASVGTQANGVGDTIEQIVITDLGGTAAKIVVNVFNTSTAVAPPVLDLRWRNAQTSINTPTRAGSLNPDSNYIGLATSAAAVNANTRAIERSSGGGPVQLGSTTTCPGETPGPCTGVAGPGLTTFPGPTWAAADGVSVSGVGGFGSPFFGTSAAAPHAAGCDILVRETIGAPASPVGPIKDRLADTATDTAPVGVENVTGAGLLDCFAAIGPPVKVIVYVGYLDNVQGTQNPANTPTPFDPDAQTILISTGGVDTPHDTGVIRFENRTDSPVIIDPGLQVTTEQGVFQLRDSFLPITLAPGQNLVLAETENFNFDTSSFGGLALDPVVSGSVNGRAFTFIDTTRVLLGREDASASNLNETTPYQVLGRIEVQVPALTMEVLR